MTKKEWEQVIDRRAQYMSAAPYSSHTLRQARALVKNFFTKNIAMAGGNYLINSLKNKKGNLQAFFMCADIPAFYNPQRSDAHMWFYSKGPFKSNQQWFAHQLEELGPFLLPDTKCRLFGQQQDWLPFFLQSGFHLDSFETVGLVDHALKVLDAIDADDIFSSRGIRLRKISQDDLNVIPQMFHREFLKRPEHCFFGKDPAVIPFMVGKLKNQLSGKDRGESLVLEKSGVVVGHIEFSISPKNNFYPNCGGMGLLIDESMQGQGLLPAIYKTLLEKMKQKQIKVYRGTTAHPAVLKWGKKLGRKIVGFNLAYGPGYYPLKHFLQ